MHQQGGPADHGDVELAEVDDFLENFSEENIMRTVIFYTNQTLCTIALCYRDFASWPPPDIKASVNNSLRCLIRP